MGKGGTALGRRPLIVAFGVARLPVEAVVFTEAAVPVDRIELTEPGRSVRGVVLTEEAEVRAVALVVRNRGDGLAVAEAASRAVLSEPGGPAEGVDGAVVPDAPAVAVRLRA